MDEKFLNLSAQFVNSTKDVFRIMVTTELKLHSPTIKKDRLAKGDITGLIPLTGVRLDGNGDKEFCGLFALTFRDPIYFAVASRMLGEDIREYGPDVADVGAELVNIILGKTKPAMQSMGIQLGMTSPSTIRGPFHEVDFPQKCEVIEIVASSDLGDFYVNICYQC